MILSAQCPLCFLSSVKCDSFPKPGCLVGGFTQSVMIKSDCCTTKNIKCMIIFLDTWSQRQSTPHQLQWRLWFRGALGRCCVRRSSLPSPSPLLRELAKRGKEWKPVLWCATCTELVPAPKSVTRHYSAVFSVSKVGVQTGSGILGSKWNKRTETIKFRFCTEQMQAWSSHIIWNRWTGRHQFQWNWILHNLISPTKKALLLDV